MEQRAAASAPHSHKDVRPATAAKYSNKTEFQRCAVMMSIQDPISLVKGSFDKLVGSLSCFFGARISLAVG
jgi:hypothetical protein